jgi:hypothetical protein
MKKVQGVALPAMLFAALCISVMIPGVSQAQGHVPGFVGKFTLSAPVQWDKTILPPGDYTVTIEPRAGMTSVAFVRDGKGSSVGIFMSQIGDEKKGNRDALLLKEKDGHLRVCSLELASLEKVLLYDAKLAGQVMEAHAQQAVPVVVAKQ